MTAVTTDRDRNGPRDLISVAADALADEGGSLVRLPLAQLVESPWNPRKHFDPAKLAEMVDSLKKGQLAPIIVRPWRTSGATYEIGAGHRRFRAAPAAGLGSLLAIVREMDDVAFLELLTIENKQRDDVAPLDEANGFKLLMEKAGYDVAKLAARIGLSTKYVYDRLKLLQLIPAAKKLLEDSVITAGHAILLARLTPTDQKRAMGDPDDSEQSRMSAGTGGLYRPEIADRLELEDRNERSTIRSVRELQQWVTQNVRAKPETIDPFLFPETVEILTDARESKEKIVHITHEYRVPDGARDEKERTYGENSWERADGRKGSKKCELSVIGLVVAGPEQGEAFRVCVNKHRCKVHWKAEATAYEKREKAAKAAAKYARATGDDEKPPTTAELRKQQEAQRAAQHEADLQEMRDDFLERVIESHKADFLAGAAKRAEPFKHVPADSLLALCDGDFYVEGKHTSEHADRIEELLGPELPGQWRRGYFGAGAVKDAAAARSYLGLQLYLALDVAKLDVQIDREVEARATAALKAEADEAKALGKAEKKPATKKPKKGARR